MSKIQSEYDLIERSLCQQLKAMGWPWIEGGTDVDASIVPLSARLVHH
jgi:hypothetical protein